MRDLLRELMCFRDILLETTDDALKDATSIDKANALRLSLLATLDRSMLSSVEEYHIEAENDRSGAENEVKELHDQRDRFLITLSHELRNQLSPIQVSIQLAKNLLAEEEHRFGTPRQTESK